uniref:Uncharacterized protein n=1 Tax=Rangifer tarandus platyrhynchus TaxID=3082113 RepID=A0ACB0F3S8_RANTA|nr:unnamed protein product [Rangifer tarandus platyrhynchus]
MKVDKSKAPGKAVGDSASRAESALSACALSCENPASTAHRLWSAGPPGVCAAGTRTAAAQQDRFPVKRDPNKQMPQHWPDGEKCFGDSERSKRRKKSRDGRRLSERQRENRETAHKPGIRLGGGRRAARAALCSSEQRENPCLRRSALRVCARSQGVFGLTGERPVAGWRAATQLLLGTSWLLRSSERRRGRGSREGRLAAARTLPFPREGGARGG